MGVDSTVSAVIADGGMVVDDGFVVRVMDVGEADVIDRSVVVEIATSPISAGVTNTGVAEPVINAAVEADVGSPVASVPCIHAFSPSPISRRPEHPDRSDDP